MGIKPGPKPIAESTGKEDKRRRVHPENKPKPPGLKEQDHKKGEYQLIGIASHHRHRRHSCLLSSDINQLLSLHIS
ncbi:hypothetical protein J8839_25640 [Klebsiella pneumoniae]